MLIGVIFTHRFGKGIQLDELADHGSFIMAEFASFPDPKVSSAPLIRKELPEFLKRYQRDALRARVGAKLHEANKAVQVEMKRVEQDTLDFFTKHWNVISAFATGLPAKVRERLSSGKMSISSVESKEREDAILEALDLIVETPSYIHFSTMREYQVCAQVCLCISLRVWRTKTRREVVALFLNGFLCTDSYGVLD